ncbi:MAG: AraC family transcriptional regulator, partial [Bacteroidales bacterium]|nr:AraC family transcriptional regulator [Bacteroidales bacterium]
GYSSIIKTGYLYDNRSLAELTANGEEPRMTDISTKQDDKVKYKQIDPFLPYSEEDQIDDNQSEPLKLYLPRTETDRIYSQLIYLMEEEKLFLNPMLKLSDLAKNVNVPESYLSKIINYYEKKNFYDFVGYYRVEEFLRLISLYDNEKYSMYYLAFEAGFNSKSTFNNVFRRIKGMSPSEYIKMNKKGPNSSARTTF